MTDNKTLGTLSGIFSAIAGAGASLLEWLPDNVETAAGVMAGLTLLDFVSAFWGAAILGQLSSTVMRKKFAAKALQYLCVLAASAAVGALMGRWEFIYAGLFFVCGTETVSVLENALLLESVGVSMGPFKPLLDKIRGAFAITNVLLAPSPPHESPSPAPETPAADPPIAQP